MELFALLAAYAIMRATGKVDGLTGPGGLFPGIELGPRTSTGSARSRADRYRRTERLAPRPGPRGVVDHGRNRWAAWTDKARRWGEDWADRIDADRAGLTGPDTRPWRRRLRDQHATCSRCGHGGLTPHASDCSCTRCLCHLVEAPRRPTPTPAGGDGAVTPTIPDPVIEKAVPAEKETPVSVTPVAPSSSTPVGYPAPPSAPSSRVPVAPSGSTPAGVGSNVLPVLDLSDVRFQDARQGLGVIARWLTTLADGLGGRDVDTQTLGMIANMRDVATTTNGHIVRVYGAVEEAVNSSSHVAQLPTYKAR